MRVKLINYFTKDIVDKFSLNMKLEEVIKYLESKYDGDIEFINGVIHVYIKNERNV